jgi:hypothetical protein
VRNRSGFVDVYFVYVMRSLPFIGFFLLLVPSGAWAQVAKGGEPHAWGMPEALGDIPVYFPAAADQPTSVSVEQALQERRFGVLVPFEVDVVQHGSLNEFTDGTRLIRTVLMSPGAKMIAVQFDRWDLPDGATVFLYTGDRSRYIGGFDRDNRSPLGDMATAVLPGEAVVIEYKVPPGAPTGQLRVRSITHGVADPFTLTGDLDDRDYFPGYSSAACHINVACPQASQWQVEKRAVAMFLRPDGGGCTGTLINNTAQPGRALFYAANHCYQPNTSQWVFYFNYEAPLCVGDTGSTQQTLTGATTLATDYYADFALLELNTPPPPAYRPYYAGWDRIGATPQSGTVIHHPLYDVKKFTHDNAPATSYSDPEGILLWRNFWDQGIVEAVSSGSALWDQNRRIVGHMTEGAQDCTNAATVHTGCAKFQAGWEGPNASSRKRDWLDPANTTTVLNGYDPYPTSSIAVRPKVFLEGPYDQGTDRMSDALRTQGLLPTQEPYTDLGFVFVGGGDETTTAQVFNTSGANAVVDWVVVELRSPSVPGQVVASRSALLQRDGDVVGMDGISPVTFGIAPGSYHVAVRHRNHLGIMTASQIALSTTAVTVDLSNGSVPVFGGTEATKLIGSRRVLYAGDANADGVVRYTGSANDRDLMLLAIGGTVPTATVSGYRSEDVTLDGVVRYTGAGNDRDIVLQNIGGTVPTAIRTAQLP